MNDLLDELRGKVVVLSAAGTPLNLT